MYIAHFVKSHFLTRQWVVWVTLLEILKQCYPHLGFECESKAFGLDFIVIKELAQKSKLLEL